MNYRAFIEYSTSFRKIVRIIQEHIHGYVPLIIQVLLKYTEETDLTKRTNVKPIFLYRDISVFQISRLVRVESQSPLEQSSRPLKCYFYACSGHSV